MTLSSLGASPAAPPKTSFQLSGGATAILGLAANIEALGAAAYLGQLDRIQSKQVLATFASIHTVEGRHAAALNAAAGANISPEGAFAVAHPHPAVPRMSLGRTPPAESAVGGMTRGAFLVRGALASVAAYGAVAATSLIGEAAAQATSGDLGLLNFLLTLEHVEASFYSAALSKAKLGGDVKALATELGGQEAQHVSSLSATITELGGTAAPAPSTHFAANDSAAFLRTAQTLEDAGVSAYNGVLPLLSSPDLIADMGSIAKIEARHAAAVRVKNHAPPAPNAFDRSLSQQQALKAIKPYVG